MADHETDAALAALVAAARRSAVGRRIQGDIETRLLQSDVFAQEVSDEDMALAQKLVAERTPIELAAAFIRLQRADLPPPGSSAARRG